MKESMSKKRTLRMSKANLLGIVFLALAIVALLQTDLAAENFVVTNLNDSGQGSLRWAIDNANAHPGADTIKFAVAGTIDVLTQLPELSDSTGGTTIDGSTAPGYLSGGAPVVVLNGPGTSSFTGLVLGSVNNELRALQVGAFATGIWLGGSGSAGNAVVSCYVGNDGAAAVPNGKGIVEVFGSSTNNRIGTDGDGVNDLAERNVISGNLADGVWLQAADGIIVAGNYIGTDATGTYALGNGGSGIWLQGGGSHRIGTDGDGMSDALEGNLISGNGTDGVGGESSGNIIAGNYIGTDVTGTLAIANAGAGINLHYSSTGNRIGTNGDGLSDDVERNVISGNSSDGLYVSGGNVLAGNYIGTDATGQLPLGNTGNGVYTSGGDNRIGTDGNGIADAAERNVISANGGIGVRVWSDNIVAGNYIGTNASGTLALGNAGHGVYGAGSANRIGTDANGVADQAERNIISGNFGSGIALYNGHHIIAGNYIGLGITGVPLGNAQHGVAVQAFDCTIGGTNADAGNTIAYNSGDGVRVWVSGNSGDRNAIRGNAIYDNVGLGIDLNIDGVTWNDLGDADGGANALQNYPVLISSTSDGASTTILGTLYSSANTTYELDFFSNNAVDPSGWGEGKTFLGSGAVTTDGTGKGDFVITLPVGVAQPGLITSTATDPNNNSSEFSAPTTGQGQWVVTNLNDSGDGSLRWALTQANTNLGPDMITFAVAGTIELSTSFNSLTVLPVLSDTTGGTTIDGTTAPGFVAGGPPVVAVSRGSAASSWGLEINSSDNVVRSLQIVSFGIGIYARGENASRNMVTGCYIGTDGTVAMGNGGGVIVEGSDNVVGTDGNGIEDAIEGNLISGNGDGIQLRGTGNVAAGNLIGTDPMGTTAIGNHFGVYVIGNGARVGTNGDGVSDALERNIISGNDLGIHWTGGSLSGVVVAGNYVGTDVTGTLPLGNRWGGMVVQGTSDARIGTNGDGISDDLERNIISANGQTQGYSGYGIELRGSGAIVIGNYIGTDAAGTGVMGNSGSGISITGSGNIIGGADALAGNVITFSSGSGIQVAYGGVGNQIRGNSIHSNGMIGIDLHVGSQGEVSLNDPGDTDTGPNNLQNFPVITTVIFNGTGTTISGVINSTANTNFTIDLYGNTIGDPSGFGEGQMYLGTTMCLTDSGGNGTWTLVAAGNVTGLVLSSTATDPTGNTSEFSAPQPPQTNLPPVANAGSDQTAHIGDIVTLDGSQSNDPDGNYPLTYSWTIVQIPSGSLATLTNPDQVNPTITIDKPGTYTIQLIVTDSLGAASGPAQVNISTINSPPVLNPIGNKIVDEGNLLEFTVTAADPDGDTLSYSVDNLPTGSNFDPQTQLFSWTPEFNQSGSYQVVFIVTDSGLPSQSDSETITITVINVNRAPEADARPDQTIVGAGKIVTLDGSFSYDPDEDPITYQWSFESMPPGSTVVFSDPTVVNPSFTPDILGDYIIKLTVSDGSLMSEDSITITAVNTPVSENGQPVTVIDEPTGITITYSEITSPGNTTVLTSDTNPVGSLDPNFKVRGTFFDISTTATYVGDVTICIDYSQLGVNKPEKLKLLHWELVDVNTYAWVEVVPITLNEADNTICGTVANLSWFVLVEENHPPVASAGENISINTEDLSTTIIQGTGIDQDWDDTLQYRWKEGETVLLDWSLGEENGECPLELITTSIGIGTHTLTLEITDSIDTSTDNMILTIENSAPHAGPTGGGVYEINSDVTLDGFVSDYDGDFLSYWWKEGEIELFSGTIQTIPGGDPVQLPNDVISNLTLGVHIIALFVDDGINNPVSSEITVNIVDTGPPTLAPVSNKTILWPPNHQMENITIETNASDNSGIMPTLAASVYSNEPEEGLGDGDMKPDWTEPLIDQENGIISLELRAERSGTGDGRIYTISITAADQSGNTSTVNIEIIVPHDKKKK